MKKQILTILLCTALNVIAAAEQKSEWWSEDDTLMMHLELIALPDNNLQQAQIKLTATNVSTNNIVLDKTLSAGFYLRFKTNLYHPTIHSEKIDVTIEKVQKLDTPHKDKAHKRFIQLKPGESLYRIYDLAKPIRQVAEGHNSEMNSIHQGFYYEAMQTYRVPSKAKLLEIAVFYERGVWMMSTPQFEEWHGRSADALKLWNGRARSNKVIVKREQDLEQERMGRENHKNSSVVLYDYLPSPVYLGRHSIDRESH